MLRPLHPHATRIALALVTLACAGALAGCNQPPALTKAELDAAKAPEKHPKIDPKLAKECRKCHREQPPIAK